jgi:hypothetical protein
MDTITLDDVKLACNCFLIMIRLILTYTFWQFQKPETNNCLWPFLDPEMAHIVILIQAVLAICLDQLCPQTNK